MRLGRQRGRKRILAPDGSELTPPTKPEPDGTLVKALARAWRWQRLLNRSLHLRDGDRGGREGREELGHRGPGTSQPQIAFLVGHLLRGVWPWSGGGEVAASRHFAANRPGSRDFGQAPARYSANGLVSP